MDIKNWGGRREGAGRQSLDDKEKKRGLKIYVSDVVREDILKYGVGNSFSEKACELIITEINNRR